MSSENPYRDRRYPEQTNPFASPLPASTQHPDYPVTSQVPPGLWRDGKTVVAAQGASFPDRCVKCNAPAHGYRLKRNYFWHEPWIYLLIIPGILIYAIVAMILRKQARFYVGLCPRHRNGRLIGASLFSLLALGSIVLFSAACFLGDRGSESMVAIMIVSGLLLFLVSLIGLTIATSVLRPKKIDNLYAWLKGAGGEFLQSLPPVS